ncbi:endonuclease/exonuclease/phosphatase family protein [Rhodothermus marinus]|uniref:endonuclease/exonuclease/phosphatase family protein n=1 Tax=Rhodothermus marinus TaxID=29549 RepID=UPI0006D09323|nr:endonuclease/exonuclease/phosphatase family protein [Rhodothermus marinus]
MWLLLLGLGILMARPAAPDTAVLRVVSYNLRYDNPADGPNAWPYRIDRIAAFVRFYERCARRAGSPSLHARQPAGPAAGLPLGGVGRTDGRDGGEFSAIFYRTDRLELLESRTFWLSPTPEVPGSRGWDAALERICTWARFRDRRTGRTFFVFNTHFDHEGTQARLESARLLHRVIAEHARTAPVLLTGDFNTTEDTPPYRALTADGLLHDARYRAENGHYGPRTTWNGFERLVPGRRIDFIFVTADVRVLRHAILVDLDEQGRFASDHLPVLADVLLSETSH